MSQQKQHRQDKVDTEKSSRKKAAESPSIQRQKGGQAALPKEREKGAVVDAEVQRKTQGRSGSRDSTRRTSEYSDDL